MEEEEGETLADKSEHVQCVIDPRAKYAWQKIAMQRNPRFPKSARKVIATVAAALIVLSVLCRALLVPR